MGSRPDCAIGVMAKAPRPGFSKTRLCPPLQPEQAAGAQRRFSARHFREHRPWPAGRYRSPATSPMRPRGRRRCSTVIWRQAPVAAGGRVAADAAGCARVRPLPAARDPGDAGARSRVGGGAELRQSDVAHRRSWCARPWRWPSDGDRVVLGPADDGGYYLLGMKAAHAHLFADIAWSTDSVAETTRLRAARTGAGGGRTADLVRRGRPGVAGSAAARRRRGAADTRLTGAAYSAPFTALALAADGIAASEARRGMTRLWLLGGILFALTMAALSLHVPGALSVGSLTAENLVRRSDRRSARRFTCWRSCWSPTGPVPRRAVWVVLLVAAAMRLPLIVSPAFLSTDVYRYVWDGRVQAAGINPYRYMPGDPALASLRDDLVYPRINRADYAPTIYPPAAQVMFRRGRLCLVQHDRRSRRPWSGLRCWRCSACCGCWRRRGCRPNAC